MKTIILVLLLIGSVSSFATTIVMYKTVTGTSVKNCALANIDLFESIEALKQQGEVSKIRLKECGKTRLGSGATAFSQEAKVELIVSSVYGNY